MEDPQDRRRIQWLERFPELAAAVARLRPAAHERFMMQLHFQDDVLSGFSLDELRSVLPAQVRHTLLRDILLSTTPPEYHAILKQRLEALVQEPNASGSFFMFGTGTPAQGAYPPLNICGVCAEPYDVPTLRRLHRDNLLIVFDAFCSMELTGTGPSGRVLLTELLNTLQVLLLRRMATPWRLRRAQAALLRAGCYAQARQLAEQHRTFALPTIPHMRDCQLEGPSAWKPEALDGVVALHRDRLDLDQKRWWIASTITYSAAAESLAWMLHTAEWDSALAVFGGWLCQSPGGEPIDALPAWNLRHPRTPAWPVSSRADWPFTYWEKPILFVAEGGRIIGWIQDWQDPVTALAGILQRYGLAQA